METSEPRIDSFVYEHELHFLIFSFFVKKKTCFKSVHNPSCIDLILTNNAMAFEQQFLLVYQIFINCF